MIEMQDAFGAFDVLVDQNKDRKPLVSIVMSVHNGGKFIDPCLRSILEQSFADFEFIILEDGSTDASLDFLLNFSKHDSRLRIVKNKENIGLTKSLIRGISLSGGQYIARQDVDDQSDVKRLARQMDFMPEYDFVCCRTKVNNRKVSPKWITAKYYRHIFPFKNPFIHGTFLMKRILYEQSGGYNPDICYAQDYDLMKRILGIKSVKIKYLTDVFYYSDKSERCLSLFRKTEQNLSFRKIRKQRIPSR